MSCSSRRPLRLSAFSALLLGLVGVACQPLPQPFAHPEKAINPAAAPTAEFGGITILSISGMTKARSLALSQAFADALVARDILAGPGSSNPHSKFIQGTASVRILDQQRTRISIVWDLFAPDGTLLGTRTVAQTVSTGAWRNGDPQTIKRLAGDAGTPMAVLVRKTIGDGRTGKTIALHVRAVDGVSARDSRSFRRALSSALKRRNFAISEKPADARLIVAGRLKLGPETVTPRPVEIIWSVLDQGGKEVGKLTQRNTVTPDILKSGWTALAPIIADNAAGGVGDLVLRLPPEAIEKRAKNRK